LKIPIKKEEIYARIEQSQVPKRGRFGWRLGIE